jgi:DNA repair protein RadC
MSDADLVDLVLRTGKGAALELAQRFSRRDPRPVLDVPRRVVDQVPSSVRGGRKEHFVAFYVNARSQLIHSETVSVGTLSASLVHPREVFAPAIAHAAAGVIVAHNHPSGDCTPSPEDCEATRRLRRSGELLGIPVLDHVIVSERGFLSFKEQGLLS